MDEFTYEELNSKQEFQEFIMTPHAYKLIYVMSGNCDEINPARFNECITYLNNLGVITTDAYLVGVAIYENTQDIWEPYVETGEFNSGSVILRFDSHGELMGIQNAAFICDCDTWDVITYSTTDHNPINDLHNLNTGAVFVDDTYYYDASNDYGIISFDGAVAFIEGTSLQETNLKGVDIPCGCMEIGSGVFAGCQNLSEVIIPSSVGRIGDGAFGKCTDLHRIDIPGSVHVIRDGVFEKSGLEIITLGDGVEYIGDGCFVETPLTELTIPSSVNHLGEYILSSPTTLNTRTLSFQSPSRLQSINDYVFYDANIGRSVNIPEGVESIGKQSFYRNSIDTVVFPTSMNIIGAQSFGNCPINKVTSLAGRPPHLDQDAFDSTVYQSATLYVPQGALSAYQNDSVWGSFGRILVIQ